MHGNTSARNSIYLLLLLAVSCLIAGGVAVVAEQEDEDGDLPMLPVTAVSGDHAGDKFCFCCQDADKTYAVVTIRKYNDMVMDFAKQMDELVAQHDDLGVLVVLLEDRAEIELKVKRGIDRSEIEHVTFGFPWREDGPDVLEGWPVAKDKQSNVFLVEDHKIAKSFTAGCPHCDGVAAKIGKAL